MAYHPFVGGAEVAIREITDRIKPEDIEFHMVTLRYDRTLPRVEKVGNIVVHRIGISRTRPTSADLKKFPLDLNKPLYQIAAFFAALRLHRTYHFDATWAIMAHSSGIPAALFKMWKPSIPYLLTLQEGDPLDYIKRKMFIVYPLFKRAFTKANAVQTISTFLGRFASEMGFKGKPIVISNGVDVRLFSREFHRRETEDLKQTLHKKVNSVFLVTTSRLVRKNGIDDVIQALALLPEYVEFLIIGTGLEEKALRDLADSLDLEERVRFLGEIPHAEIPKYLKVSDIFIRPSRSEGMGNSFIEAMAAGIPVIATQEGGIADFLFDPEKNPDIKPTGLAVKVGDHEAIARQVMRYTKDVLLRREVTDNARALVQARYDWKTIVRGMRERVFNPLLTTSEKSPAFKDIANTQASKHPRISEKHSTPS